MREFVGTDQIDDIPGAEGWQIPFIIAWIFAASIGFAQWFSPYTGKGPPGTYVGPPKIEARIPQQEPLVPTPVRVKTVKFHRPQEPR